MGLSAPTISLVITIYKRFCSDNTRDYRQEVIITACFYLVGKIVEDQRRIREILAGTLREAFPSPLSGD